MSNKEHKDRLKQSRARALGALQDASALTGARTVLMLTLIRTGPRPGLAGRSLCREEEERWTAPVPPEGQETQIPQQGAGNLKSRLRRASSRHQESCAARLQLQRGPISGETIHGTHARSSHPHPHPHNEAGLRVTGNLRREEGPRELGKRPEQEG